MRMFEVTRFLKKEEKIKEDVICVNAEGFEVSDNYVTLYVVDEYMFTRNKRNVGYIKIKGKEKGYDIDSFNINSYEIKSDDCEKEQTDEENSGDEA